MGKSGGEKKEKKKENGREQGGVGVLKKGTGGQRGGVVLHFG
jgi:hypothetical protein